METCYNKCISHFFKYCRLESVTDRLSEPGLPSFRTLFNDCVVTSLTSGVWVPIPRVPHSQGPTARAVFEGEVEGLNPSV